MGLLLALLMGLGVWGIFAGIIMYRAETKLPSDLMLALEVGSTRTGAVDSLIDRMGMRYAPAVLRLMGPKQVAKYRRQIDLAGNPGGLTIDRYGARRRRPPPRPLRRPPRGPLRARRARLPGLPAARPALRGAAPPGVRRVLDGGRHLVGDPRPQGRHRTHAARLPGRAGRGGERGP